MVGVAAGALIGGATRGDVGGIPLGHETRAFSDDAIGARTMRSAALGRSSDVLAARRSLAVVVSAQESRRGGWQSSRTVTVRGGVARIPRGDEIRAFSDDAVDARTTRPAALGRSSDVLGSAALSRSSCRLSLSWRTKRGAEMLDWAAVAHLPSYKVRRTLRRWSIEVPRAIMPNRQRTMHRFYTAAGARVPPVPAPLPTQATAPAPTAPGPSHMDEPGQIIAGNTVQGAAASAVSQSEDTATPTQDRRHNIAGVPAPWGVAPQQDALRGVITSHDSGRMCSYQRKP